jgi:hypothetical protein
MDAYAEKHCQGENERGERCQQAPLRDADFCFWHDPAHATEAAEARRLGGLRRKREHAVAGAYDIEGLEDLPSLRRVLTVAALDLLGLENSIARSRALIAVVQAGTKLLEVGELEERVAAVERVLRQRPPVRRRR